MTVEWNKDPKVESFDPFFTKFKISAVRNGGKVGVMIEIEIPHLRHRAAKILTPAEADWCANRMQQCAQLIRERFK